MSKLVEVRLTKCRLLLYEHEIFKCLPPDLLKAAIRRGKYVSRMEKLNDALLRKIGAGE